MKNKFLYIGLATLGVVGFFVGRSVYLKRKRIESIIENDVPNTVISESGKEEPFLLKSGSGMGQFSSQLNDVKKLQELINQLVPSPYKPIVVDGKFGKNTLSLLNLVVKDLKISTIDIASVNSVLMNKLIKAVKEKGVSYLGKTSWL
mgnify:FL=1|tara:strand:+ start:1578 stop:2018 length:441 start_codon:yes stop_codon:yes gene_type:complete